MKDILFIYETLPLPTEKLSAKEIISLRDGHLIDIIITNHFCNL